MLWESWRLEINEFADLLQSQRLGELEATALLRCVISSMDAPVLAFDPDHRLRLINPAAERIFHLSAARALGAAPPSCSLPAARSARSGNHGFCRQRQSRSLDGKTIEFSPARHPAHAPGAV